MDLVPLKKTSSEAKAYDMHMHDNHSMKAEVSPGKDEHQHTGGGHAHHAGMIDEFRKRFYVVLVLTIPIITLSPMIQHWLNADWSFAGSKYLLLVLSSIVFFYGGWPFLTGLANEVRSRLLGMMTLVAVAITVAYVYSVAIVLGLEGMDSFGNWQR
jgi:Cu2+-exporting ATPase